MSTRAPRRAMCEYVPFSHAASQKSAEFPFAPYTSFPNMYRGSGNTLWHPPMLPPDSLPHFIHPGPPISALSLMCACRRRGRGCARRQRMEVRARRVRTYE